MKSKKFEQAETLEEKFPNEAKFQNGQKRTINEDNHFREHSLDDIRRRYLKFTVFMEALNQVLELDRSASVDHFAKRIVDLVHAANQEDK